jgi:hypothetical protein
MTFYKVCFSLIILKFDALGVCLGNTVSVNSHFVMLPVRPYWYIAEAAHPLPLLIRSSVNPTNETVSG